MLEALEKWWIQKYKLPSNHELFLSQTKFSLLVEFWEDYFSSNSIESHRNADGHVQFTNTGDNLIDKWEVELAQGGIPDLLEGFSPEQLEKLKSLRAKGRTRTGTPGRSMKAVVDSVSSEAAAQGLTAGRIPARKGWTAGEGGLGPPSTFPSTFGKNR